MIVFTRAQLKAILAALVATDAPLEEAIIKLFKNDFVPDMDSVIGDFEEADFTGYAASTAIVWGTAYVNNANQVEIAGGSKQFRATASTVANTVYGYIVVSGTGALVYSERFDEPVLFAAADDAVVIVPRVAMANPAA